MKLIRGGGDALREEALHAVVRAMLHNRPEDWERVRELDRRLSHRATLYLAASGSDIDRTARRSAPSRAK